jgi:DNA polymerase (family 10)
MEVDILADGRLDLDDEHLAGLDVVVVSVHSRMRMSKQAMTDRVIRALEHPAVDILAHPTGRILNQRAPYEIDLDAVLRAAAELDVAVELNAKPDRLDLSDVHVRRANELGVKVVIDTDAHSTGTLEFMRHGVDQARRGWLEKEDVLNTMHLAGIERWLARRRGRRAGPARAASALAPWRRPSAHRTGGLEARAPAEAGPPHDTPTGRILRRPGGTRVTGVSRPAGRRSPD